MNINGTTNLRFKKVGNYILWSASISTKDSEGNSMYTNMPVSLTKKVEEEVKKLFKETKFKNDKDKYVNVNVSKGFISFYKDKENKTVIKLVVTEITPYEPKKKVETDEVKIPF